MTLFWCKKIDTPPAQEVFDFAKCEAAFLDAGYQVQQSPFLVRTDDKWRPLHDGELARFMRLYLAEIGRTDLFDTRLIENFLAFVKAGA